MIEREQNLVARGFIDRLSLTRERVSEDGDSLLELELREGLQSGRRTRVRIKGFAELVLRRLDADMYLLLSVQKITDRQLERLRYQLRDTEHEAIECLCNAIEIEELGE